LDPELGPDDDDSDDERAAALASAAASSDPKTADLLVCQFEKVKHLANRDTWKVVLRDGILRINQRDYVFSKATGEFEW
jgi:transcription initiation factor TFIIA large subunit